MRTLQLFTTVAATAVLSLAGSAQLSAELEGDPGLEVAAGKWFQSANYEDSREVMIGHIHDDKGAKVITMVATLRPDDDPLQGQKLKTGLMYGELRLADQGDLSSAISEIFKPDPGIERRIELIGRWEKREGGNGQFEALVTWGGHVIIGELRGTYGPDLSDDAAVKAWSVAKPLSQANPFGLNMKGNPLTYVAPSALVPNKTPFSTPPKGVEAGDFVAELVLYTL